MADVPMADVPQQADAEGFNAVPSTAAVAEMDVAGTVTDIDLGQPGGAPLTPDPATASTQTSAAGEASTAASADPLSVATPQGSTEPETAFVGQPAQAEAVSAAPEAEAPPTVTAADGHIQASDIAQEAATAAVEAEAPSGQSSSTRSTGQAACNALPAAAVMIKSHVLLVIPTKACSVHAACMSRCLSCWTYCGVQSDCSTEYHLRRLLDQLCHACKSVM